MEVELCRIEAFEITGLNEATAFRTEIILCVVGQRPMLEAEGNAFAFDVLLTNTSHDLRDVDVASLAASCHHVSEPVACTQTVKGDVA